MLYQLYESQRSLLEPFADFAQVAAKIYNNPNLPASQSQITLSLLLDFTPLRLIKLKLPFKRGLKSPNPFVN